MKHNELITRGRELRQNGFSFKEISDVLGISKSTASLWLRNEKMTDKGRRRFDGMIARSVLKGVKTNAKKKRDYQKRLDAGCSVMRDGKKYGKNDLKIFLALLYWGEGSKTGKRLCLTNSDPGLIKTYLKLLRKVFVVDEKKFTVWLYLHDYHEREEMISFWSEVTAIDRKRFKVYNKKNTAVRKKDDYRGCASVRYGDYKIFDEIMIIISRFSGIV